MPSQLGSDSFLAVAQAYSRRNKIDEGHLCGSCRFLGLECEGVVNQLDVPDIFSGILISTGVCGKPLACLTSNTKNVSNVLDDHFNEGLLVIVESTSQVVRVDCCIFLDVVPINQDDLNVHCWLSVDAGYIATVDLDEQWLGRAVALKLPSKRITRQ